MRHNSEISRVLNWALIHLVFEPQRSRTKIPSLKNKYDGKRSLVAYELKSGGSYNNTREYNFCCHFLT